MGPRTWRTTTTCAALLLTATGCVVGPTINDTKPAAATAPTDVPQSDGYKVPTGNPGQPTGGAVPPGGGAPGVPNPPPGPTAAPKLTIGGDAPHEFSAGVRVWIDGVAPSGGASNAVGTMQVALRLRIFNGSDEVFKPDSLTVDLSGCPAGKATCKDGRSDEDRQNLPPNGTVTVIRFFRLAQSALSSDAAGSVNYKGVTVQFSGPFGSASSTPGSAVPSPSGASSAPGSATPGPS